MSRRRRAEKRDVLPDPKFGDLVVTKFMNYVMYEGKKAVAENIIYGAFDILEAKRRDQSVEIEGQRRVEAALDRVAENLRKDEPADYKTQHRPYCRPGDEPEGERIGAGHMVVSPRLRPCWAHPGGSRDRARYG